MNVFICEFCCHDRKCPRWQEKQRQQALDECCKPSEEKENQIDQEFDGDF
jgi:hypothetical protein